MKVYPLDEIVPFMNNAIETVESYGGGDKPLIFSEIGAGAIYGWRDQLAGHWSEEYQSDHLEVVIKEIQTNPRFSGVAIWQYCDGRTYASSRALGRPRAFNNKGTLDEYRRPKLAYRTVRSLLRGPLMTASL